MGVGLLLGGRFLAACGDDDDEESSSEPTSAATSGAAATTAAGELTTVEFQLNWVKNAEYAGNWIADDTGIYAANGLAVNFTAGGPGVSQEQAVISGNALVGLSGPDITGPAILEGAPLIALGALFQKNPFAFMSLAENPVSTAQDLIGKKVGVQDVNQPIWQAFLKANDISESDLTVVPVQFDPQGLVTGEVDAWMSFVTNEPNVLRAEGVDVEVFLLADEGYPLVSQIYFTQTKSLTEDREALKRLLTADIIGWRESLKDPALGATLAAEKYGKDLGLNVEACIEESKSQNELILTEDTKVNGIMTVTDTLLEQTITSLGFGGIDITLEQLFDFSILEEVYAENPDLKPSPIA